jgi:hypothetical protein
MPQYDPTPLLLRRAWEWAAKIEAANARAQVRDGETSDFEPWDVHALALALEHLMKCLKVLKNHGEPDAIKTAAAAFRRAWGKTPVSAHDSAGRPFRIEGPLRELRNVLEHEEDYIADSGHHPELVASGWDGQGPGVINGSEGIKLFVLFGVTYELRDTVAKALECDAIGTMPGTKTQRA